MKKSLIGLLFASLFILPGREYGQENEYDVPYVPSKTEVVAEMLKIADVCEDDVLYDLGCGDGRIVISAAEKMGTHGVGVDINPERIKESRENAKNAKVTDFVQFIQQDLFKANISEATVVMLYLLPEVNLRLRPKLLRELKPGTRVVSHDYSMGEWEPVKTSEVCDEWDTHTVYYWVVPANVTGTWKWNMPAGTDKKCYVLRLNQHFTQVNGIVTASASEIPIKDAKLSGDRLQFTLEQKVKGQVVTMRFEGSVSGNSIEGNVESQTESMTNKSNWKAIRDPSTITTLDSSDEDLK